MVDRTAQQSAAAHTAADGAHSIQEHPPGASGSPRGVAPHVVSRVPNIETAHVDVHPAQPIGTRSTTGASQILLDLGRKTRDAAHTWDPAAALATGRNAHRTNTEAEMGHALGNDYNWLEGDLRVGAHGELVMAHDKGDEGDGLTLDQWLEIGGESGRGLKVDVKEKAAIPALLDALEASGIPQGRLMLNFEVETDSDRGKNPQEVAEIRARFPEMWLALNPGHVDGDGYDDETYAGLTAAATAAGDHHITFPTRSDRLTDEGIERLAPHGDVSVWVRSKDEIHSIDDYAAATTAWRERGVTGVIDLGPIRSPIGAITAPFLEIATNARGIGATVLPVLVDTVAGIFGRSDDDSDEAS